MTTHIRRRLATTLPLLLSAALVLAGAVVALPTAVAPSASAATTAQSTFVPLPYSQLVTTTDGSTAKLSNSTPLLVQVAGRGNVPTTGVAAVSLDVTTVNSTSSSWVSVVPSGSTSGITNHFTTPGQQAQNNVYVALGSDGKVKISTGGTATDVVVAVTGYFREGNDGAGFYPSTDGLRYLDTRAEAPLEPGETVTINTEKDPTLARASSVALSVTTVDATARGYLTLGTSSRVGLDYGTTAASSSLITAVSDGAFTVTNSGTSAVNVLVDLQGYFVMGANAGGFTASISRIHDTRNTAAIPANGSLVVPVAGRGSVPATSVSAYALDVTVLPGGSEGYLRIYPEGKPEFGYGTVNFEASGNRSNSALISAGDPAAPAGVVLRNRSASPIHVLIDSMGYFGSAASTVSMDQTLYEGAIGDENGMAVAGETVNLYAWPRAASEMVEGDTDDAVLIGTAVTEPNGAFTLDATEAPGGGGTGLYDVMVVPASLPASDDPDAVPAGIFSETVQYSAATESYDLVPSSIAASTGGGEVVDANGETLPTVSATTTSDGTHSRLSLTVPREAVESAPEPAPGTAGTVTALGCSNGTKRTLLKSYTGRKAVVSSIHATTNGHETTFSRGRGADISIGTAIKGSRGWSASGTSTVKMAATETWPTRTSSGNVTLKTDFTAGKFKVTVGEYGVCSSYEKMEATKLEGGTYTYSTTEPKATYCKPYSKGAAIELSKAKQTTWSAGFDLGSLINLSTSTQAGWSSEEKLKVKITATGRKICGTNTFPVDGANRVVVKLS